MRSGISAVRKDLIFVSHIVQIAVQVQYAVYAE